MCLNVFAQNMKKEMKALGEIENEYKEQHRTLIFKIYEQFPPKDERHRAPDEKTLKEMEYSALKKVGNTRCCPLIIRSQP